MKLLKQKMQYFISLGISFVMLICMFFAFLVVSGYVGINGFTLAAVQVPSAWYVFANILHVLVFALILTIMAISILEILSATKVINFKVTFRKVTSYIIIQLAFIMLALLLVLEVFMLWFTILYNKEYGLVFGAGVFVELGICILGFLLLLFLERAGYFNKEETQGAQTQDTQKDIHGDDIQEEIVIEPEQNDENV